MTDPRSGKAPADGTPGPVTQDDPPGLPAAQAADTIHYVPVEAAPADPTDPIAQDSLPAPKGASRALLGSLLVPHRGRVAVAAVLLLLQQAAVQAGPLLIAITIDHVVPALRRDDHGPLTAVGAAYLLCTLISGSFLYASVRTVARITQSALLDLRGRIYRQAQALSLDFHDRYTSGRLIARSTSDVESLRELIDEGLQELIGVVLSVVCISVVLLWLDPGLGAAAGLSFVPLCLLVRSFRRRSMRIYRKRSSAMAAVIVKFTETMNGIRPVQAFCRERANNRAFDALNHHHERVNGDSILEMARYVVSSRLVANTAVAGIVLWGAHRVASGTLALGVLAAAALYLRRLYDPIDRLGTFLNSYQSAAASLERSRASWPSAPACPSPSTPYAPLSAPPSARAAR